MWTRREALLAAGSAAVIAGCGGRPARTLAGDPRDLRILNAALEQERLQVALYEAGLKLREHETLRTILAHERRHALAVEQAIRDLGGTPAAPRPIAHAAVHRTFGAWRKDAVKAEDQWSAGYAAVIPKLANPRLRSTFAALMTSEAEHAAALELI